MFVGHFPQKNTIFSGSFVKRDLQLKVVYASSSPNTTSCASFETSSWVLRYLDMYL